MTVTSQRGTGLLARTVVLLLLVSAMVMSADGKKRRQQQTESAAEARSLFPENWPDMGQRRLIEVARWRTLSFDFGGNQTKEQLYRSSGRYNASSIIPIDSDIIVGSIFMSTPPFRPGTPASFSVVSTNRTQEPPLRPFPSWEAHATTRDSLTDCSTQMVSVFRFTRLPSDSNIMYMVDSGVVDILSTFERLCAPKIVTLDVQSATILNTTVIDKESCNSLYIAIQVEQLSDGRRVAYSADVTGYALAVTDLSTGQTHRVISADYYPSPRFGVTVIAGVRSYLMDGLFALGIADGSLYSWAFASNTVNKVATRILRNATDFQILDLTVQTQVPGQRAGPAGALAIDSTGRRMFFGILEQEAIYCWDTRKPYQQFLFRQLAQNTERLQFPSSVKILPSNNTLLVVTDRFQLFGQGMINEQSFNYRVMTMDIRNLNC